MDPRKGPPAASPPAGQDKGPEPAMPVNLRRRALQDLFYGGQRVKAGRVFTLKKAADHSSKSMIEVDPSAVDEIAGRMKARKPRPGSQPAGELPVGVNLQTRRDVADHASAKDTEI